MKQDVLRKMAHGSHVAWVWGGKQLMSGRVVSDHCVRHPNEDVYVQWDDGQRTDAFDNDAVKHIQV